MKNSGEIKIIDGEKYEVFTYKSEPYLLLHEQGIFIPVNTPKRVGQKVIIDWKAGDDDIIASNPHLTKSFRPPGIPDSRTFVITTLENNERYFLGYTESDASDASKSITEIFWDGRGGWTERGHQGKLCFSNPILTFLP